MPHFIIDRSDNIITKISPNDIMKAVYDTAEATGLFASGDIKLDFDYRLPQSCMD